MPLPSLLTPSAVPAMLAPLQLTPSASRSLFGDSLPGAYVPVTVIGYDHRMLKHFEIKPPKTPLLPSLPPPKQSPHPERPDRLASIASHLIATGVFHRCRRVDSREVTNDELALVHSQEHVRTVFAHCDVPEGQGRHFGSDTYTNCDTATAARLACGTLIEVTRRVVHGEAQRGVALIRPPGHHAEPDRAMGFCLFNNVGVATQVARREWGVQRVLIVDWDVHHGNGTQDMFEDDPSVLYFSTHRYDGGSFYPGTGRVTEVGSGAGVGYTINVPWPCGGMGDAEYLAAWDEVLMPVARQFAPDLVFISAGFDAAAGDPLGGCCITPTGYAHLTSALLTLAGGRVVVALEGGYNLKSISTSMEAVVRSLLGEPPPPLGDASVVHANVPTPSVPGAMPVATATPAVVQEPDAVRMMTSEPALKAPTRGGASAIASTILIHSRYWSCLRRKMQASRKLLVEYSLQHQHRVHGSHHGSRSEIGVGVLPGVSAGAHADVGADTVAVVEAAADNLSDRPPDSQPAVPGVVHAGAGNVLGGGLPGATGLPSDVPAVSGRADAPGVAAGAGATVAPTTPHQPVDAEAVAPEPAVAVERPGLPPVVASPVAPNTVALLGVAPHSPMVGGNFQDAQQPSDAKRPRTEPAQSPF